MECHCVFFFFCVCRPRVKTDGGDGQPESTQSASFGRSGGIKALRRNPTTGTGVGRFWECSGPGQLLISCTYDHTDVSWVTAEGLAGRQHLQFHILTTRTCGLMTSNLKVVGTDCPKNKKKLVSKYTEHQWSLFKNATKWITKFLPTFLCYFAFKSEDV